MSTISLRVPDTLHRQIRKAADEEGISVNQFIVTAVAERLTALMAVDYLEERASRGSREKFGIVLAKVPDVEPDDHDKL